MRNIFSREVNLAPSNDSQETVINDVPEEIQNQLISTCNHKFGPSRFVKGGGREQVCKLCGFVKHVD